KNVTIAATAGTAGLGVAGLVTWTVKKNDEDLIVNQQSLADTYIAYDISALSSMSAGMYPVIIEATSGDFTQKATVNVTVKDSSGGGDQPDDPTPTPPTTYDFSISPNTNSLVVNKGGDARTVTITVSGTPSGDLTWDNHQISGLSIEFTNKSNSGATVSVKADSSSSVENATVTIEATDAAGTTEPTTFKVRVSGGSGGSSEPDPIDTDDYESRISSISSTIKSYFENSAGYGVGVLADSEENFSSDGVSIAKDSDVDFEAFEELDPPETPVAALPEILEDALTESKIYVFKSMNGVSISDTITDLINEKQLLEGEEIFVHMIPDGELASSADYGIFLDDDGNEITTALTSYPSGFNIAAYLEEETSYLPVISKYKLSFDVVEGTNLTLPAGATRTLHFVANKDVHGWSASIDEEEAIEFPSAMVTQGNTASIPIQADADAELGDYGVTIIAEDVDGTEAELNITVTVTAPVHTLTLSADASYISLTRGGVSKNVTITASGDIDTSKLSWSVKNNGGLIVRDSGISSSTRHTYSIGASSDATIGSHTVVIEVSDDVNVKTVSITANVTSSGGGTSDDRKQDFIDNRSDIPVGLLEPVNESVISSSSFLNAIKSILASAYDVASLDISAFSSTRRTAAQVTESFEDEGEEIVLALPLLEKGTIEEAKVYVFVVDIRDKLAEAMNANVINYNSPLYVRATKLNVKSGDVDSDDVSEVVSLADAEDRGVFLDDDGNELTTAQEITRAKDNGKNVNVAVYLEPDTDYSIVITTDADNGGVIGPSGAGCIAGSTLGLIAMSLSSGIFHIRKKTKRK
ncbi:MAG: hypothetical protein IJ859_08655, partial [Synergistaceae bacterium]|nr:hypothetical protein [Synergistaceae bacterium]